MAETIENPIGIHAMQSFQYASEITGIKNKCKHWKPMFASIVAALASILIGTSAGYPSPAIPNLNAHRNPFRVNSQQQSWFGSLSFLSGCVGTLVGGLIIDKLGRKFSMMIGTLPTVISWTVIAGAGSMDTMYIGRVLNGFGVGFTLAIIEVYISEISPPEIRGHLMSFHELCVNVGVLLMYVVGTYVPWNWLAIICATISCLQAIMLLLVPESPRWLIMNGQAKEAVSSLNWLRGEEKSNHEAEITAIRESLKQTFVPVPWLDYLRPPLLKCFFVSQFLFILQELSGVNVIRVYTVTIFQDSGSSLDANMQTIIVGIVLIVGSCIFTSTVDCFGRRKFLISSSITVGISMAAMGTFFKINSINQHFAQEYLFWLPLLSMMAATLGFVLGIGPLPYVFTSELFSTRARGRASGLGVTTLCFFGFLTTKFFVDVSDSIGADVAFWFCGGVCILGAVVGYFMVPETKGKMLEELQQNLGQ